MELSQLTAYAEEKYHIMEEHKWENFPGFSVLCDPATGKWSVLLMRQWDGERGEMIECCDIKCGCEVLKLTPRSYLSAPYQMKGKKWVGVRMGEDTEEEIVLGLFDRALKDPAAHGAVIVLGGRPVEGFGEMQTRFSQYEATAVPETSGRRGMGSSRYEPVPVPEMHGRRDMEESRYETKPVPEASGRRGMGGSRYEKEPVPEACGRRDMAGSQYEEVPVPEASGRQGMAIGSEAGLPERLVQLKKMFHYSHDTFQQKCEDFYAQARFMEDYEDDHPWKGEVYHYYPVYQDLRTEQLRGYFTWRAAVRRGEFYRISSPMAYIYVYELLNGVGADSPEDALRRLGEFETGYLESGIGNADMIPTVRRWSMGFAVVNLIDPEVAGGYLRSKLTAQDKALAVLKQAEERGDGEVFEALCEMTSVKLAQSPVAKKEEGARLFADLWRYMQEHFRQEGKGFFELCFGTEREAHYHPLTNAVYRIPVQPEGTEYIFSESRRFLYRDGAWHERSYPRAFFDRGRLDSFLHEADRLLRLYLGAGRSLKPRGSGAWATPFISAFLEEERKAREEASRPNITIEFSRLKQIRQDAAKTCESLLTEEERELEQADVGAKEQPQGDAADRELEEADAGAKEQPQGDTADWEPEQVDADVTGQELGQYQVDVREREQEETQSGISASEEESCDLSLPLDPLQLQIMRMLIDGEDTSAVIRERHLMPAIVADEINEAFYDEIGDTVVDCDGNTLMMVEDYIEEVRALLGR